MSLYKTYWKIGEQLIRCSISFNKETVSWATNERREIGYRVSVTPIQRSERGNGIVIEEFGAFTGFGDTLLPIDRQSKKRLQTAITILEQRKETYLNWFNGKL